MNRSLKSLALCVLVVLGLVRPASSISIDLAPATVSPSVGDIFSMNVVISGLVPQGGARSEVGAFDIDLSFATSSVSLVSVAFGVLLGDPTSGEALTDLKPGTGIINFAEVSLLPTATLDALQPDTFTLATVSFQATAAGTSTLSLSRAVVANGGGGGLPIAVLGAAEVTASSPSAVPEPKGVLLFAIGFATVAGFVSARWRTRS